jgi:hypothetical protein
MSREPDGEVSAYRVHPSIRGPDSQGGVGSLWSVVDTAWYSREGTERRNIRPERFSGLRVFIVLHSVMWSNERLLEATMNLAQFPENQNKSNHGYEQQEWDVHLFVSSSRGLGSPGRLLKGTGCCRKRVVRIASDQANRANHQYQNNGQHNRVLGDVLALVVPPQLD